MKLSLAAAILAETIPVVSSSFDASARSLQGNNRGASISLSGLTQQVIPAAVTNRRAQKQGNGALLGGSGIAGTDGQRLKEWTTEHATKTRVGTLRNLVEAEKDSIQACDPFSEDADVGVLSCGDGRYCLESSDVYTTGVVVAAATGSLGGICVQDVDGSAASMHRHLQTANTTLIQDIASLCYNNTYTDITCQCSGVDIAAYAGKASCSAAQSCTPQNDVCGTNTTICYTYTYTVDITAPYTADFESCFDFTTPSPLKYCLTGTYTGTPYVESCAIGINDAICNSCELQDLPYGGAANTTCRKFDCYNTYVDTSGVLCNNTFVDLFLRNVLYYNPIADGPCPTGCNLCGEGGNMTNLDVNVTFPTGDTVMCGTVNFAALTGYFAANGQGNLCTVLPSLVAEPCGCTGGAPIPSDAPAPTSGGADSPTLGPGSSDSPVAPPSEEGSTATPSSPPVAAPSAATTSVGGMAVVAAGATMVSSLLLLSA